MKKNYKIAIYVDNLQSTLKSYIENISTVLEKKNYKIYLFGSFKKKFKLKKNVYIKKDLKLEYFLTQKDPRVYENFFNFSKKNQISHLIFPRLLHPEYLLSEMKYRENQKFKIFIGTFSMELFIRSLARINLMKEVLAHKKISRLIIHSIEFRKSILLSSFPYLKNNKKVIASIEPISHTEKNYFSTTGTSQFPKKKFKLLYFGNFFYGKGADILLDVCSELDREFYTIFAGNIKTVNYPFKKIKKFKFNKRIKLINSHIDDNQMFNLFRDADLVVLPYRKTYKFGSSGVLIQAIQSNTPVVVPNISPFKEIVKKFNLGEVFISENNSSLKNTIIKIRKKILNTPNCYQKGFEKYKLFLGNWEKISSNYLD
jgi:glycosyltransferase involved in cell wall biosynthesis